MNDRVSVLGTAEVQCEVDLSRDDYLAFARYLKRHERGRVFWASVASYGGAIGAAAAAISLNAPIAAVLALVAAVGSLLMQKWTFDVSQFYTGRCRYSASADSLVTESEHVVTRYRWRAFVRSAEAADHFFLFTRVVVVVLPKRGFASTQDLDRFRVLVTTSIGSE